MFEEREKMPEMLSATNIALAIGVHILFFFMCWVVVQPLRDKETVIPIDLTLVVHENLDGEENKPPPTEPPKPEPPKPKPEPPKPEPPKPKPPEVKPDAVVKEAVKTNKVEKVEKKPEPPKKTAKELREDRIKKMLESAKVVNTPKTPPPKPQNNGKTGKKTLSDAEIAKLLNQGYKPGATEQLATSEEQRCVSLIYNEYYSKWDSPAYSSSLREMILQVTFDMGGRVVDWRLTQSSGDGAADATVRTAAQRVKVVPGLSESFLRKNKTVSVRFKVKPQ